jgi:hypothetical protein
MIRPDRLTALLAATISLTLTSGCADKLTRHHFDMIQVGVAREYDVEQTIGEPDQKMSSLWNYERLDDHLIVLIHFGQGLVIRKEWHDAPNNVHFDSAENTNESVYESTIIQTYDD